MQQATNYFLHTLYTSYLAACAADYTFEIYRFSVSQKAKSAPHHLCICRWKEAESQGIVCVCATLDYATDPKFVLMAGERMVCQRVVSVIS